MSDVEKIQVIVQGGIASGKSSVMKIIRDALLESGSDYPHLADRSIGIVDLDDPDEVKEHNLKADIVIIERQVRRSHINNTARLAAGYFQE